MDKYSINARLYPMAILLLPIVILGITYSIEMESYLNVLSSIGISAALSYFLAQIGRDNGQRKEKGLWEFWGGAPVEQLFSFQNCEIDEQTKKRYHKKMETVVPLENEIDFSSATTEETKGIYQSWTKYLITNTRDTKKYSLVFKELISYGFRRNLWGLKSFSIFLILACMTANFGYNFFVNKSFNPLDYSLGFQVSEITLLCVLLVWIFIINRAWAKIPAFAYAERLLETIDNLID